MSVERELSIVIAVKEHADNLPAILDRLRTRPPDSELFLCFAGPAPSLPPLPDDVHVLTAPANALIPHLWRDGIRAARGHRIALSTAECIPEENWAALARNVDIDRWAGMGGAIDNHSMARPAYWAIFFLRYSAFAPPIQAGEVLEIAADNAVYARRWILAFPDLLEHGFWEPSFHRQFRKQGGMLAIDPEILVIHHGLVAPDEFAKLRRAHGFEYGLERGLRASRWRAIGLLLRSPVVPPLILTRILRRIWGRRDYRAHLVHALPWLVRFVLAWARGEAAGYASALAQSRIPRPRETEGGKKSGWK